MHEDLLGSGHPHSRVAENGDSAARVKRAHFIRSGDLLSNSLHALAKVVWQMWNLVDASTLRHALHQQSCYSAKHPYFSVRCMTTPSGSRWSSSSGRTKTCCRCPAAPDSAPVTAGQCTGRRRHGAPYAGPDRCPVGPDSPGAGRPAPAQTVIVQSDDRIRDGARIKAASRR